MNNDNIDLHVRWSDRQDLVLNVNPDETIYSIKEKIRHSVEHAKQKYIRLIHKGKVLCDNQTLKSYGIGKINEINSKATLYSPIYINCSLSDYTPQNTAFHTISSIGFDKLRDSGFTEEDIQYIRTQFHRLHGTTVDRTSKEAKNLEEQWLNRNGETLVDEIVEGTYKEMVWGFIFGLFLGIICLFWFRNYVFSKKKRTGIVAGMLINISFGIFHVYY
ncbi:hypothetical protein G6F37_001547 [Rhizopus arrhizus]|nr:hypothetical protein G6F38_003079 [Rhizopus arrhizus]KAG1163092.1 hypothetical protein G6F37_001547 [Rhizopus arrhizus]